MNRTRQTIAEILMTDAAEVVTLIQSKTISGPYGFTVLLLAFAALVKIERDAGRSVPSDVIEFTNKARRLAEKAFVHLENEVPKAFVQ